MAVLLRSICGDIAPDRDDALERGVRGIRRVPDFTNSDDQATRLLLSPILALGILCSLFAARPFASHASSPGARLDALRTCRRSCAPPSRPRPRRYLPRSWRSCWSPCAGRTRGRGARSGIIGLTIGQIVLRARLVPMAGDASNHFALMVHRRPSRSFSTPPRSSAWSSCSPLCRALNLRSMATLASCDPAGEMSPA